MIFKHIFCAISAVVILAAGDAEAYGCTSAIVRADLTKNGKVLMWKHRDTGTEHNFVERVESTDSTLAFVALFNGGDSLLREAWTGMNEAGFAIMNTASYNLAPDTAKYKDMEGVVMRGALEACRTLEDFERYLSGLPKPMGVQANFGAVDAGGEGAYYETDDYGWKKFSLEDSPDGIIVRTNFSISGNDTDGMGYIRYENACHLLKPYVENRSLSPEVFTEELSRSFYHYLLGKDMMEESERWVVDQDFIPRYSSSASIVIEGVKAGENPALTVMWTAIGYPPCSHVIPVMVDSVAEELRPVAEGWRSQMCNEVLQRKHEVFPIRRGSGKRYIDMDALRRINRSQSAISREVYRKSDIME